MGRKLKVAILFGGKSAEHEVSLQSAKNVSDFIDKNKYEPVLIGIDKSGRWFSGGDNGDAGNNASSFLLNTDDPRRICLNPSGSPVALLPQIDGVDAVFPILHGPFGEDGTVQGLLKLADLPFVGAGVLASAVGMDKDVMKRLLRDAGLPIGKFRALSYEEKVPDFDEVSAALGLPLFVKPANMGSSVGVSKVRTKDEFLASLATAFEYDTKVMIEEFIPGREIECSVLGSPADAAASIPGEIKPRREFYSYEAKYIDEHGAELIIPAALPAETVKHAQELSLAVFKTLCCDGLARVDFFLKDDGSLFINELNTMPGFTRISMYPKLWEASGISYTKLIDRLIELAVLRFQREKKLKTSV
ncbi:MAG: D-alanine--D-alanine ligase [Treponema sp.]|nr:D-alanine--D-alanine ligase [Treponema sp.]